jgi:hypothetical protein
MYKYGTQPSGCSQDLLDRMTEIDYPGGGQTTLCYNDSPFNASANTPSLTETRLITSATSKVTTTALDGMGHVVRTLLTSDPDGTDTTDNTYYGTGNVYTRSNPHRSGSAPTDGTTVFSYDSLGRNTLTKEPDGSGIKTTYDQTSGNSAEFAPPS